MSRTIDRILVPVDFSAASDAALDYAKMLAAQFGARLYLLHILEEPLAVPVAGPEAGVGVDHQRREAWRVEAEARLLAACTPHERQLFAVTSAAIFGVPTHDINAYAGAHAADLIVMGTHGRTGLAHLLLGSVAERTVRTATCPVVTVHAPSNRDQLPVAAASAHALPIDGIDQPQVGSDLPMS